MVRPCQDIFPLVLVALHVADVVAAYHGGGTRPTIGLATSRRCTSSLCFVPATSAASARCCGTWGGEQSTTLRQCSEFTSPLTRRKRVATGAVWPCTGGARWRRSVVSCNSHATSTGSQSPSRVTQGDGTVTSGTVVQGDCHWHVDGSSSSSSSSSTEASCINRNAPLSGRRPAGQSGRRPGFLARGMATTEQFFANDGNARRSRRGERAAQREQGKQAQGCAGEPDEGLSVPRHVAFVMDGNGRWAADRKMPRSVGHTEGARRAREAVEACQELGVNVVTLYAFSTENWSRPAVEVSFLMELMEKTLREQRDELRRNGIRLVAIGELDRLPLRLRSLLEDIQEESFPETGVGGSIDGMPSHSVGEKTTTPGGGPPGTIPVVGAGSTRVASHQNGSGLETRGGGIDAVKDREVNGQPLANPPVTMTLCVAISYGGRTEVAAAARELAEEVAAGRIDPGDIDEGALERRLSTSRLGIPDPDLVIRTSGESRLSNLLLWQAAYSELCVVSKAWPEFRRPDLEEAFREFGRRRRRFGKTPEQMASL